MEQTNADLFRRASDYVDKILRVAKPCDLPLEQPTKFELVINLITAKALVLYVSLTLLARVDELIVLKSFVCYIFYLFINLLFFFCFNCVI